MGAMRKYWTKILRADVDAVDVQSQHQRRRSLQREYGGDDSSEKRSLGPVNPLTSASLIIVPVQVGDKHQKDKEESQNSPKLRATNAKIG